MQRRHTLVVKRYLPTHQHIEHDSETPYVHLRTRVDLRVEELRRRKVKRTTEGAEAVGGVVEVRETEVNDLDVARVRDEDVLDLEIWKTK